MRKGYLAGKGVQNEVRSIMNDQFGASGNQPISSANLFFLLQELAALRESKRGAESPVSDEQIEAYQRQKGIVL